MKRFNPDDPIVLSPLLTIEQSDMYSLDRVPEKEVQEKRSNTLPSKAQMIKNLSSSVKNISKSLLKGEKIKLPKKQAEERMKICMTCPQYVADENRCSLCGCYLRVKIRIATESCPINKW